MHNFLKKFLKANKGSVAPIFAGAIMPILFISGAAIDYSTQIKNSAYVHTVADASLLSVSQDVSDLVSKDLKDEDFETQVTEIISPLITDSLSEHKDVSYKIDKVDYDEASHELKLAIEVTQDTTFIKLAKVDEIVSTVSTGITLSAPTKTALSVAFVLDKSGSMSWYQRWPTLKTAMSALKEKFKELDPDKKYIRTGLTMFDSKGYSFYGMKWNMQKVLDKLNTYNPGGGTNSSYGMVNAYNYLNAKTEEKKHKKRNDSQLRKVILFMTDGVNGSVKADNATLVACNAAKSAGMEIYAVSFGAQGRAKIMLENCSSGDGYYISANDNAQLIDAFDMIGDSIGSQFYLSH